MLAPKIKKLLKNMQLIESSLKIIYILMYRTRVEFGRRLYGRRLLNVWNLTNSLCEDVAVFTEHILNNVVSALQNFHETLYITLDKSSKNI